MNHLDMKRSTFVLPTKMLEQMRTAVKAGMTPSVSAFVREALKERLYAMREEALRCEFEAAAVDPRFIADIEETMDAFRHADAETARMIPKW